MWQGQGSCLMPQHEEILFENILQSRYRVDLTVHLNLFLMINWLVCVSTGQNVESVAHSPSNTPDIFCRFWLQVCYLQLIRISWDISETRVSGTMMVKFRFGEFYNWFMFNGSNVLQNCFQQFHNKTFQCANWFQDMTHIYIFQSQPRPECPDLLRLHPPELHPPGLHRESRHHAHYTEQRRVTVGDFTQSAIFLFFWVW